MLYLSVSYTYVSIQPNMVWACLFSRIFQFCFIHGQMSLKWSRLIQLVLVTTTYTSGHHKNNQNSIHGELKHTISWAPSARCRW